VFSTLAAWDLALTHALHLVRVFRYHWGTGPQSTHSPASGPGSRGATTRLVAADTCWTIGA